MPERMANKAKDKSAGAADQASNRLGPKADAATDKARSVASNAQSGAQQSSGGCSHAPRDFPAQTMLQQSRLEIS